MNIFDRVFLRFFLLAMPLFRKLNVNPEQLKAILVAKLTMDNRRPAAFAQMRSREKKELNKATLKTMLGSLFMGLLFLVSFELGHDLVTRLTVFFSMFVFILAATLITDFTSVLIDVRDNLIILPKPVSDSTVVTARLMHIAIHINKMVLPMALPSLIAVIILNGIWAILPFMLILLLATLLSIFLINAVYILILRFTTPAKFQSIISYIQIGFAILIYGGYQLVPRMMENSVMVNTRMSQLHYIQLYPPYWFAEACNSLIVFDFGERQLMSLALSFLVPLLSIWIVVRYFAPAFNRKLAMINGSAVEMKSPAKDRAGLEPTGRTRVERLATMLTTRGSEYMGFVFTWKMMSRSRDFKMKVYPAFGYVVVLMVMMLMNKKTPGWAELHEMSGSAKTAFLFLVYFSSFILITALGQLTYSEKYKAAWIFSISPLQSPGPVICGAVKSVMSYFYIPVILFISLLGLVFGGIKLIPNLLLGAFNILAISSLIAYFTLRELPFSVPSANAAKSRTVIRSMMTMMIPAVFGIFQWIIFDYLWIVMIFAVLAVIATWMVLDSIKNRGWAQAGELSGRD